MSKNHQYTPYSIGFMLIDNFTLISLASSIEPLRMANQLAGRELYRWYTLSLGGSPVRASDGLQVTPDAASDECLALDMVIVCGGVGAQRSLEPGHLAWLQQQAGQARSLGAVCTGSWALAQAGLLDGYEASIHWECLPAMQEAFPRVALTMRLFSVDRDRATASGGIAPMDMMLSLIGRDHGRRLSAAVSEMFLYDHVRGEEDQQRVPLQHLLGTAQPKLFEIVALMEANLEEPIGLDELARFVGVSRRHLERLFQKHVHCSPSRYYLELRLTRARQLLRQTLMTTIEVASACGFVSGSHFSRAYADYFTCRPRDDHGHLKANGLSRPGVRRAQSPLSVPRDLTGLSSCSRTALALAQARGEPTYASVPL